MAGFVDEIKARFKSGDVTTKLIYVNAAVFLALILIRLVFPLFTGQSSDELMDLVFKWGAIGTNNIEHILFKPYTFITHMFIHDLSSIWHLFGNMLMLYFLGKIFLNYFSSRQLLGLYFLGGLLGAAVMVLITIVSPLFTSTGYAVGASGAVMAISIAACFQNPNLEVRLFGVLPVKMLWIGIFLIVGDLVQFYDGNTGGHIAHLGGSAVGFWFVQSMKKGKDITVGINKIIDLIANLFKPGSKLKVAYSTKEYKRMSDEDYNRNAKVNQEAIDEILDKISVSGYDSLSKKEKEILFKHSNK